MVIVYYSGYAQVVHSTWDYLYYYIKAGIVRISFTTQLIIDSFISTTQLADNDSSFIISMSYQLTTTSSNIPLPYVCPTTQVKSPHITRQVVAIL